MNNFGIAVDIGTTTVALKMIDLESGNEIASVGEINAQTKFGADVTSRIMYCIQNGHERLTTVIQEQINTLSEYLFSKTEDLTISEHCDTLVIAANTVMQHLAAGYSPVSLGTAPFKPISLFGETQPAWNTYPAKKETRVYYTPAVSAYVGGDITAGLLAAGFEEIKETALFVDIGTNGEIVLKHDGTYYCCATAAGPAFEGLTSVKLYGSELVDLLAHMLSSGMIDKTGRLISTDSHLCASDIRALQLAKAAIAAGIQILLYYAGIKEEDVTLLALAGGFGSYLNPQSAAQIGLFPKALLPVAKAYGNTALDGAALALRSSIARAKMENIRRKCEYIELSSNAFFNDKFVDNMGF